MVNAKVQIIVHVAGDGSAVTIADKSGTTLSKHGAFRPTSALAHFLKIETKSIAIGGKTEKDCAKLLLALVGKEVPSNWTISTDAKFKNHDYVGGGWEPTPTGTDSFGFAFLFRQRKPGSKLVYQDLFTPTVIDGKSVLVEYLAVVSKA